MAIFQTDNADVQLHLAATDNKVSTRWWNFPLHCSANEENEDTKLGTRTEGRREDRGEQCGGEGGLSTLAITREKMELASSLGGLLNENVGK